MNLSCRGGISIGREGGSGHDARIRYLRLPLVEVHWSWTRDGKRRRTDRGHEWDIGVAVTIGPLWGRTMLAWGMPPGSRIGAWVTRGGFSGRLRGVNVRVGRRYVGPALTWLAHGRVKEVWQ